VYVEHLVIVFVYNAGIFDVGTVVESLLLNAHMFE
jgi:hypothetical protein